MSDDSDEDLEIPVILIDFNFEAKLVRMMDNIFLPSALSITAEVAQVEGASDADMEAGFTKIKFWLENCFGRSIAFKRDNAAARSMLLDEAGNNRSGNMLMVTPDDPDDSHIAALLQAKMTALSNDSIVFGNVTVSSNNTTGLTYTFAGDGDEVLPDMDNWIGPRTFFELPWWHRNDASTLDVVPPPDADLTNPPAWAYSLEFITAAMKPPASSVVLRPSFKPTVIDGGKTKDKP